MRVGITLVAVFMLTMFSLYAFSSITIFIAKQEFAEAFRQEAKNYGIENEDVEGLIPYVAWFGLGFSLLYLLTGIGLVMRSETARKAGMAIGILHGIYGLLAVYIPPIAALNLVIATTLIYYLRRDDVREEFVRSVSIEERILGKDWEGKIN